MENNNQLTAMKLFAQQKVQDRFEKLMGDKANGFISSVLQTVNNNKLLKNADPITIMNAAATGAALDLPINQNLGFAWIVPYKGQAQFQIGWKGFVQLALRTGQYQRLNVTEVYDNQFKSFNRLTEELNADFEAEGTGEIVGYAGYFRLISGMEKTTYWTKDEIIAHAKKYSQSYGKNYSPWSDKDQFHGMAKKTVVKNMISKWGIMSIDMQTAQLSDQSVQSDGQNYDYPDNIEEADAETVDEKKQEMRDTNDQQQIDMP